MAVEMDAYELQGRFLQFLQDFHAPEAPEQKLYVEQLQSLHMKDKAFEVDWEHLDTYDEELASFIKDHHLEYEPALRLALLSFIDSVFSEEDQSEEVSKSREAFWLSFKNPPVVLPMRDLRVELIGTLTAFRGTVTRTSEVRPELYSASFRCGNCQTLVNGVGQQFKYTQPLICTNSVCGNRQDWELITEDSEFIDWQRAKAQECTDEVPAGSLPRAVDVILRRDLVEQARAGDRVVFFGNLIVVPDVSAIALPGERVEAMTTKGPNAANEGVTGLKNLGVRDMRYKLAFLASSAQSGDPSTGGINIREDESLDPTDIEELMTADEREHVGEMRDSPTLYGDLAKSLAPGVYGHEDVKRSILLMLLGGVHKSTAEGINLRGDINIAIVGDPSCAKSQMLKYVANFLPRAVFTSGKASSAAGLTASVAKEPDGNEFCIEAGALMLADNGICCIDEFDKMDEKDQVAIHEAMEQQTISIAKAGIQATLNARTSILAAANPYGGRYDKSRTLRQNVNLPPAILSRFDLLHVMVDEPNEDLDSRITDHIIAVHRRREQAISVPYSMLQVQRYIRYARSHKPKITSNAHNALVEGYKQMRAADLVGGSSTSYRMTVRQLEALIRLSEAHARMHCSELVEPQNVREAIRLMKASNVRIEAPDADLGDMFGADAFDEIAQGEYDLQHGHVPEGDAQAAAQEGAEDAARAGIAALGRQADRQQQIKVSASKLASVRDMLIQKLSSLEDDGETELATVGEVPVPMMTQQDLLRWYYSVQIERGLLSSAEEVREEAILVNRIVQYLIDREGMLIVVENPTREDDESDVEFAKRRQRERVLGLPPNRADG